MEPSAGEARLTRVGDPKCMKILVIEDEPKRILARALRENGYAVDMASDGEEGLFLALSGDYDLILMDMRLPKVDGWELLTNVRRRKKTPVLMLAAVSAPTEKVRALDLGADDFLLKPFEFSELLARVRALIRRAAGQATAELRVDDVVIDTRSRTVRRGGAPVRMTAREFGILEYLVLHRGKVVSRTELYEHLEGEREDTASNLLDVHVFAIRRKLKPELITTRRGQGYCIE